MYMSAVHVHRKPQKHEPHGEQGLKLGFTRCSHQSKHSGAEAGGYLSWRQSGWLHGETLSEKS